MNDNQLVTKLHAPRLRPRLIPRPLLTKRLQQASTSTLTLISAPAGFGKTTLLAQWLTESNMPTAWLSLEPQDNEPPRFLSYLIAALQTLDPGLGTTALPLLFSLGPTSSTPLETVLTVLTNDLAQRGKKDIALILDDYHILTAEPIQQAMTFLLEHCPPQLHLLIATRVDPPLPLARLRARGQLTELRAAQLQFEASEANTFLSTVMGLDLSPEDITALQDRTEGWIAGLQLAALSLQSCHNVQQFIADFTGSHRHVMDYLVEEVLARQPEEIQSFLLHTSLLDRLTGSLCDVVAARSGSQALLEDLERSNLFLIPLDDWRHWYRYHQLFADVLRARLYRKVGAEGVAALYARASAWYERNGFPEEAVEAALAACDFQRSADLIEPLSASMVLHFQHYTLQRWLERLPRDVLFTRPTLCLAYAMTLFITGQGEAYKAPLQQAEQLFRSEGNGKGLGQVAMVRALNASLRGDAPEGIAYGKEALALLPEEALVARSVSASAVAEGYRRMGDVSAAWHTLTQARPVNERIENLLGIAGNTILRARLLVMQGKLQQAAESYRYVIASVNERHEFALEALIGLGDLLREWNEPEAALAHLERVIALAREIRNEVLQARAALNQTRVLQARRDAEEVEAAFASVVVQAQQSGLRSLLTEAENHQARWLLAQGNMEAVSRWQTAYAFTSEDPPNYQQELTALTLARVLLAQDEARRALDLLGSFRQHARTQGRTCSEIEILALTALAYNTHGKTDLALQSLQQALLLAEPEGYVRLFVDEGPPMAVLLRMLLPRYKGKRSVDYIQKLLLAADVPKQDSSSPSGHDSQSMRLLEPLSQRERKVLRLLAAGLSNPEIAGELTVSLNTVKTQVQSIYRKLNVSSRKEAIATIEHLQLL